MTTSASLLPTSLSTRNSLLRRRSRSSLSSSCIVMVPSETSRHSMPNSRTVARYWSSLPCRRQTSKSVPPKQTGTP